MRRYGTHVFKISQISKCDSKEMMNHREIYYTNLFNSTIPNGYNISIGPNDRSSDIALKWRKCRWFNIWSLETGHIINMMRNQSEAARKYNVQQNGIYLNLNKKQPYCGRYIFSYIEDKEKIEHSIKSTMLKARHRKFKVFDSNKNFIGEWSNISRCANYLKICLSELSEVMTNNIGFYHNYIFIYSNTPNFEQVLVEKLEQSKKYVNKHSDKKVRVFKSLLLVKPTVKNKAVYSKGQFVGEWLSVDECSKSININKGYVKDCLSGRRIHRKGYMFEYID